ncbi:MAG: putative sugar nucleotidyl transferase, partial [Balneolaceae bacterium]
MTIPNPVSLLLFEDDRAVHFHPLTLTRPVDDIRIGILTIREKWEKSLGSSVTTRNLRANLSGVFRAPELPADQDCLVINARLIPDREILRSVQSLKAGEGIVSGELFLAGRITGKEAS